MLTRNILMLLVLLLAIASWGAQAQVRVSLPTSFTQSLEQMTENANQILEATQTLIQLQIWNSLLMLALIVVLIWDTFHDNRSYRRLLKLQLQAGESKAKAKEKE